MELKSNIKRVILKSCLAVLFCSILLWFSVFLYGLLYYSYIPAIAHIKPIYLRFDPECFGNKHCKFPSANLTLVKKGHYELLTRGQAYTVEVVLEMPESERNYNQGMFMIKLNMLSQYGEILQSSLRPALLHYKSSLFKVLYTFFYTPGLLAGTVEEKQHIVISLFEQYEEDPFRPAHFVYIEIQAYNIEIYSSSLRIHAQFTGLRYFMYYWPLTASIIFVGTNFFFLCVIVAFIWFRQIMNEMPYESAPSMSWQEQQRLTREIRKSVRKKRALTTEEMKRSPARKEASPENFLNMHTRSRIEDITNKGKNSNDHTFQNTVKSESMSEFSNSGKETDSDWQVMKENQVQSEHSSDEELSESLRRRKFVEKCENKPM